MGYAAAAYAVVAVAAAVTAVGSIVQADTQRKTANFNLDRAAEAAGQKQKASASDAYKQMLVDEAEMASNRVYFNTHGVRIDEGTPLETLGEQAGNRAVNVAAIRLRGSMEAGELLNQGNLFQWQGKAASTASYINAGSTLLTAASSGMNAYSKNQISKAGTTPRSEYALGTS
jgi:hypothetical protein